MNLRRLVIAIGLAAGLWPSASWAQRTGSNLNVGVDISGVFDSDVADEIRQRSAQGGVESGGYSSAIVGRAGYSRNLRRVRLNGSIQSSLRYYADSDRVSPASHTGGLTAGFTLWRQANITVTQTAAYSPSYLYQLFPSAAPLDANTPIAVAQEFRVDESTSLSTVSRVGLSVPAAFGALSVSGEHLGTEFYGRADARPPMSVDVGRVGLSWKIGRRYALSTDYQYRQGDFGGNGTAIDQRLRLAADYTRPLSATRSATFRFSVSPSVFRPPPTALSGDRTRQRVEAASSVSIDLSRTWAVNGSVRRGIEYIATLSEPIFNTGGSIGVGGTLVGPLQLGVSASYSDGGAALTDRSQNDDLGTYTGSVRLGWALNSSISAYGEYLYYYYNLRGQAALAPDLPSIFERRSVRFGVSISARPIGRR
jgi:hypothetical protein